MFPDTARDFVFLLGGCLALLGVLSTATGIIILATRTSGKDVHTLANQTSNLAQKGLAEDVAGLVGNASALVDSLNQLVRTSAGIGIFLVIFGFVMLVAAYLMVQVF